MAENIGAEQSSALIALLVGIKLASRSARKSAVAGAKQKGVKLDIIGFNCSLVNNFTASAKGTGSPDKLGLLGPFRSWQYPKNFRSTKVKKAITIKIETVIMSALNILLYIGSYVVSKGGEPP